MHNCLHISEIITRIFSQLVVTQDDGISVPLYPGTLAALGRTCRAFHEPALNALWSTQGSILSLLLCMPSDLWEKRDGCLHPRRPIVSTDWCRLYIYARRIKHLGYLYIPLGSITAIGPEVLRVLSNSMTTTMPPLLPNLRSIKWSRWVIPDNESFQHIRLFLGPKIKRLELPIKDANVGRLSLLLSLPRDFPKITDIEFFSYSPRSQVIIDTISDTVCQWNQLERCRFDNQLARRAWTHLALMPQLREIDACIVEDLQLSLPQPTFPALRKLVVQSKRLSYCADLVDHMGPNCPLETIILEHFDESDASTAERFIQALCASCSHLSLTKIHIIGADSEFIIREDMLRPLLVFKNITDIDIGWAPFELGNDFVRDMAMAWPNLQSLRLTTLIWNKSHITLAGIIPLISLPDLERLGLVIDASIVDYSLDMPPIGVSNEKITSLELGDSSIQNPHLVAAFISDVLPNVRSIDALDVDGSTARQWMEVESLIKIFAEVRQQMRRSKLEGGAISGCCCQCHNISRQ